MDDEDAEATVTPEEAATLQPMAGANPSLVEFISGATDEDGALVYDQGLARESQCIGLAIAEAERSDAVFVNGALGPLNEDQVSAYCGDVELREITPKQRERFRAFADSAHVCKDEVSDLPKGEKLTPYSACMSRELRTRGHKL